MHKARENNDGSFSIGKVWMLDDLSSIQSYTAYVPKTPLEQQQKEWASSVGFVVTIGKPYYWHARSLKEKEFFIASLVKIYKKYTGGRMPELIGFDERERQQLVGLGSGALPPAAAPTSTTGSHTTGVGASPDPAMLSTSRPSSRDPSRDPQRQVRRKPSQDPALRAQKSREQMSRPSTGNKPTPPPFGIPPNPPSPLPPTQRSEPKSQEPPAMPLPVTEDSAPSIEAKTPAPMPNKDGLRPTTPGSFTSETRGITASPGGSIGQKSPYREAERPPQLDLPIRPSQDGISDSISAMPATDSLKPGDTTHAETPSSPIDVEPEVAAAVAAIEEPAKPTPQPPSEPSPSMPKERTEEDTGAHRPGLGPMVKKKSNKDVAGAFRKAANAYGAFKPRPGGAGERLLAAAKRRQAEPDGVTGVFPAPSLTRSPDEPPESPVEEKTPVAAAATTPGAEAAAPTATKELPVMPTDGATPLTPEISQHTVEEKREPSISLTVPSKPQEPLPEVITADDRSRSPSPAAQGRRRRRREDHTIKYCQALGIEPSVLEGRGIEFDDILTDLGWNGRLGDEQKIEDLEADVRREIGRVEATSWLGNVEQQEGKVEQLAVLIDKTIEECEELEGLLTLYSHELNVRHPCPTSKYHQANFLLRQTLHEDVAYIEAQSQGLQVQTANQKLLQGELQNLLKTLSISSTELRPLKEASLGTTKGLADTENVLSTLYKAMLMIDSNLGQNKKRLADASVGVYANTEFGQMRAIQERKEEYRSAGLKFLQRFKQHMSLVFKMAEQKRIEALAAAATKDPLKLDSSARQHFRAEVWMFNPLMLFAREVSMSEWHGLVGLYEQQSKPSFQNEFRENSLAWRKTARKPTGEEQELLFTHQEKEKEAEGITMAARKLTVRRGKTVRAAAGFRLASDEKKQGKVDPSEAFAGTLRETLKMITEEQNFVVEFFHLNSLANADFSDLVTSTAPDDRQCPDFSAKQSHDPDRQMAKRVEQIMDEVYSFWPNDLQSMVDWALQSDPL